MKLNDIKTFEIIAHQRATMLYKGCRIQEEETQRDVINFIKKKASSERTKKSNYVLYTFSDSFGNYARFKQSYQNWAYEALEGLRETEKCFVTRGGYRIRKANIIGYCE